MNYAPAGNKNGQIKEFNLLLPCFMFISERIFDVLPHPARSIFRSIRWSPRAQFFQSSSELISRVLCLQAMINDHRSEEMCLHWSATPVRASGQGRKEKLQQKIAPRKSTAFWRVLKKMSLIWRAMGVLQSLNSSMVHSGPDLETCGKNYTFSIFFNYCWWKVLWNILWGCSSTAACSWLSLHPLTQLTILAL